MALNGILSTSLSGLLTNQEALRVTGANISNVNTPGFARLQVETEALVTGDRATGVEIGEIRRVVDEFLNAAVLESKGDAARYDAMGELHDRLQSVLGRPDAESSLSARMNSVFTALGDLALDPADAITRQQFLSALQAYTEEVARIADELQSLRGAASLRMEDAVREANEAIKQVFDLNQKIRRERGQGGDTGGLENQRQAALESLSEIIDIRTIRNADGTVDLLTGSGARLVGPTSFFELDYTGPGLVGAETDFPPVTLQQIDPQTGEPKADARPINGDIRSGKLRGLIDMRDRQLVDMSVALGELAARVADEANRVHNLNTAVPPPNSLAGEAVPLAATAPHNFSGETTFAVINANNEVVDRFTFDFGANPGDSLQDVANTVSANLNGGTLSFTNGRMVFSADNAANGVVIAEDPATASDRAGRSFSHFFGMNDLLTAREPGLFETGVTGTDAHNIAPGGTVEFAVNDRFGREVRRFTLDTTATSSFDDLVAALNDPSALGGLFSVSLDGDGELQITPDSQRNDLDLRVVNDTTDVAGTGIGLAEMFGIGTRFRADAARDFRIVESVPANAGLLATARLDLAAGVGDVGLAKGDQSGALELQKLENTLIETDDAGELAGQTRALGAFNAAVLANFGVMAERVAGAQESNGSLQAELVQRQQSVSGVNIDEELANLVIFQNSYSAAARVLSSVQELFDSLLAAV